MISLSRKLPKKKKHEISKEVERLIILRENQLNIADVYDHIECDDDDYESEDDDYESEPDLNFFYDENNDFHNI